MVVKMSMPKSDNVGGGKFGNFYNIHVAYMVVKLKCKIRLKGS
jgi:hypothetical protein